MIKVRRNEGSVGRQSASKSTTNLAHLATDQLRGVEDARPFPKLPLKTEQWNKISALSGIPRKAHDARSEIETALGYFRQSQASNFIKLTPTTEIRKELKALADEALKLSGRLSSLEGDPNASMVFTSLQISQEPWWKIELSVSQVRAVLRGLPKWFRIAEHKLEQQKRGPKTDNMYWLVGQLDAIRQQAADKKIIRSNKRSDSSREYIAYVCRIADPHVGGGTLELAMKRRIKDRTVD
jgi:hypothetical protein